ncbi:MAG: hypothetical protein ABI831_25255 [Betaproteobacteria bacterium]
MAGAIAGLAPERGHARRPAAAFVAGAYAGSVASLRIGAATLSTRPCMVDSGRDPQRTVVATAEEG